MFDSAMYLLLVIWLQIAENSQGGGGEYLIFSWHIPRRFTTGFTKPSADYCMMSQDKVIWVWFYIHQL